MSTRVAISRSPVRTPRAKTGGWASAIPSTCTRSWLYYLIFLLAVAVAFALTGVLPYDPYALLFTIGVEIAVCGITNAIFSRTFGVPANAESASISALILALIIAGNQMSRMTTEAFTHEQQVLALVLANTLPESFENPRAQRVMAVWLAHRDQWRNDFPADTNVAVFDTQGTLIASSGIPGQGTQAHLELPLAARPG
jgi:hypothetical protein